MVSVLSVEGSDLTAESFRASDVTASAAELFHLFLFATEDESMRADDVIFVVC